MINVRQGVFHLRNEEASYLFRVKDGFLEHLHFGARAETADAPAFAARPGCGWGDSTLYREGSNADCLDILRSSGAAAAAATTAKARWSCRSAAEPSPPTSAISAARC